MKGVKSFLNTSPNPTVSEATFILINSDFKEIGVATTNLVNHVIEVGVTSGEIVTGILQWLVFFAAIYLMVMNWRTDMLTELLVVYVFLTFPNWLFGILRGDVGRYIVFIGVVLRLFLGAILQVFFPLHFPVVVAPDFVASYVKSEWVGVIICFGIGCYLLQEHIRASGGFRNAFSKSLDMYNTIGIILLFVFPVWALIVLI